MSDLIKREDAIKAFCMNCKGQPTPCEHEATCGTMNVLRYVASAERKGEWIESDTDGFICSACGNGYRNQPTCMGKPMFEYCPFCGARMKGADDGNK